MGAARRHTVYVVVRLDHGELAIRQCRERPIRPPAGLAGDFARTKDRRLEREIHHGVARFQRQVARSPPDAPRVEQAEWPLVRHERAAVLEEERSLLGEEGLEHRQIEQGGVLFDLPEVRVDGGRERRRRSDPVAQVETSTPALIGLRRRRDLGASPEHVWQQLETARRRDKRGLEHKVPPTRHSALLAAWPAHPLTLLSPSVDLPSHHEAPHRRLVRRNAEPHLRERDLELRRPPVGRHLRPHLPDGVVVAIDALVVEVHEVALHPRRIDLKDIRRLVVVTRVEADLEVVCG